MLPIGQHDSHGCRWLFAAYHNETSTTQIGIITLILQAIVPKVIKNANAYSGRPKFGSLLLSNGRERKAAY